MGAPKHAADGRGASSDNDNVSKKKLGTTAAAPSANNVRVVARIRPLAGYEIANGSKLCVERLLPGGVTDDSSNSGTPETLQINLDEKRWFELDAVLDETCSQKDVYVRAGVRDAICRDVFQGYNCTILAYGQTGAGKSFTMGTAATATVTTTTPRGGDPDCGDTGNSGNSGNSCGIAEEDGLIPRACHDLFETIRDRCDSNANVECSYMEVYNEEIRDLLCDATTTTADPSTQQQQLRIRETLDGQVYVRGLQARVVSSPSDVGRLMEEANGRRAVASTKMNATSSRSHAICVLRIKGVLEDATKFESKLTLVDLAGSERLKKTEAKGSRAQEGISINKGLFVLGQVVSALAERRPKFLRKPPFRDSKLTRLLQDSLGGNSRTIMIACCSPADYNLEETVNTLRYATQARNIRNSATANLVQTISQEEARKLKRENELLTARVEELQDTIKRLTQDVTVDELERSMSMIQHEMASCDGVAGHETPPFGSPASVGPAFVSPSMKRRRSGALPPTPELEHPEPEGCIAANAARLQETLDSSNLTTHTKNTANNIKNKSNIGGGGLSLDSHFSKSSFEKAREVHNRDDEELSLQIEDAFDTHSYNRSPRKRNKAVTYAELEEENLELEARLRLAGRDVRASIHDAAIEVPALKMRVQMLEESLNESVMLEEETLELRRELEEVTADKVAAQRAAQQLSDFMEQQKREFGFRGDELEKKRLNYFRTRLDERWVTFVVTILSSFKEQMRLLGDYFDMVVRVVESPEILTMLGTQQQGRKKTGGWFARGPGQKDIQEEKELRNRLLQEHIKFFNARLLEIEDEINNRTESVDAISEGLINERAHLETELDETEFVRDLFSKKGEKLIKHLTTIMTSPLFTLPTTAPVDMAHAASVSSFG